MTTIADSRRAPLHGARPPLAPLYLSATTRILIGCGVLIGPVFYAVVAVQAVLRDGYDIARHPISLLSLGSAGWIQIGNFIASGLLGVAFAFGARRATHGSVGGTWISLLIAAFGVGMILAGIFRPDPLLGFPPGTPNAIPASMSTSAKLHGLGFLLAFGALTAACFVFAKRFAAQTRWRGYSIATGFLIPVVIGLGMAVQAVTSVAFVVVGVIAFGWLSAVASSFLGEFRNE